MQKVGLRTEEKIRGSKHDIQYIIEFPERENRKGENIRKDIVENDV